VNHAEARKDRAFVHRDGALYRVVEVRAGRPYALITYRREGLTQVTRARLDWFFRHALARWADDIERKGKDNYDDEGTS